MNKMAVVIGLMFFLYEVAGTEEFARFDIHDFYFYDEMNLIKRLELVPKILIRFSKQLAIDERLMFLNTFSPLRQHIDPTDASRTMLEFSSSLSHERLMNMLSDINRSGIAEAIPVVLIDNIEAIAEGFVVEPRTPVSSEMLEKHLQRLGEFSVRQIKQENTTWFFILDEVKPPLHIYLLANLVHGDAWIKRAYPKFKYLHAPVVSTLEVSPLSGTIDETRTITLSIHVFDPAITIRQDLLPHFGEGTFSLPRSLFFIPSVGENVSPQEIINARGRMLLFRWRFRIFTAGELTIPAQPIAYEKNGEQFTIMSPQAPLVVTSLIGNLVIMDMPSPKLFPVSEGIKGAMQEPIIHFPAYWFDRLISQPSSASMYGFLVAIVLGIAGVGLPTVFGVRLLAKAVKRELAMRALFASWQATCRNACTHITSESYGQLENILWQILSSAFPDTLSPRPNLRDIQETVRDVFDDGAWKRLQFLYEELESAHASGFAPDLSMLHKISEHIMFVMQYLAPKIDTERKV